MFQLPASGVPVRFRAPSGHDELLLAEGMEHPLRLRVEAVQRLTPPMDSQIRWADLPYADVDAALLAFRRKIVGDRLIAEVRCISCSVWCDTGFSITDYFAANRPRRIAGAQSGTDGWIAIGAAQFRIPTVAAVLESAEASYDPNGVARELSRSSIRADSSELAARAAAMLEKLAPPLAGFVRGTCPHCQKIVKGWFDPGSFVLAELQSRASVLFEHIHLLARCYGWTEDTILALPSRRRALYAASVQQEWVS